MKALEKDRSRRYETANGLALDLQRYLDGEAVVAAPPGKAYQARKFVRRHRVMVTSGSAVAAALLLGLLAFASQARVARQQRDLALEAQRAEAEQHRQADEQRDRADRSREEEARQRALAEEQGELARQQAHLALSTVQYVLTDIDNALRLQPGTSELRIAILEKVAEKWSELDLEMTGGVRGDALPTLMAVRYQLASAFKELDRLEEADRELEKLHALAVERLEVKGRTDSARMNLAMIELSWAPVRRRLGADPGAAEALLQSAVELVRECVHDPRPEPGSPSQDEIRELLAALLQNLAAERLKQGRIAEAADAFGEGHDLLAALLAGLRGVPRIGEPGFGPRDGRAAGLQASLDKAALGLAYVTMRLGRDEESLALYRDVIRSRREAFELQPEDLGRKLELAGHLGLYGQSLLWMDDPDEAEPLIDESTQLMEEVVAEDPEKADNRRQLATALYRMGTLRDMQGRPDEASSLFERSRELRDELYVASPDEKNAVNLMLAEARVDNAARAGELIDVLGAMDGVDGERHLERARALAQLSRRAEGDQQTGLREEALTALERAIAEGYSDPFRVGHEHDLDPLHEEERFQAVMARLEAERER